MAESLTNVGVLGAAQADVRLPVGGLGGVAIQVQGTFSGTITFEASVQGQDFTPFRVTPVNSSTPVTTTTTTGLWVGSVVGFLVIRARMSSYASGVATVHLKADLAAPGGAGGGGGTGSDVNLIEVGGATISLGQAAMAASLPVVIASNQTAIPVTVTGGGGGGTASVDEDPFTAGSSSGTPAMGAYEATPTNLSDGQMGIVGLTADRSMKVAITSGGGGGTQYAQGTASTDTDVLTMAGVERRDTPANPTGVADGDRTMAAVDSEGVSWTRLRQQLDGDTGAGTVPTDGVLLLLPAPGGPVAAIGGTGVDSAQVPRVSLATNVALPAGNNNIGDVDIASSVLPTGAATEVTLAALNTKVANGSGTAAAAVRVELPTNGTGVVGLNAGTAIIGKVGIDQTTPGTTNLVAAAQSGTWTVQPGNTPNTTPWLVTAGHGKTIKAATGSISSATDIVVAVTSKRLKVIAYKLMTTYSAGDLAPKFYSNGTGGTLLDQSLLRSPSNVVTGITEQTSAPSFLFGTAAGEKLTLDPNGQVVTYRVTYYDDDAT